MWMKRMRAGIPGSGQTRFIQLPRGPADGQTSPILTPSFMVARPNKSRKCFSRQIDPPPTWRTMAEVNGDCGRSAETVSFSPISGYLTGVSRRLERRAPGNV